MFELTIPQIVGENPKRVKFEVSLDIYLNSGIVNHLPFCHKSYTDNTIKAKTVWV